MPEHLVPMLAKLGDAARDGSATSASRSSGTASARSPTTSPGASASRAATCNDITAAVPGAAPPRPPARLARRDPRRRDRRLRRAGQAELRAPPAPHAPDARRGRSGGARRTIPVHYLLFDLLYARRRTRSWAVPTRSGASCSRRSSSRARTGGRRATTAGDGEAPARGQRRAGARGRRRQAARQHLRAGPAQPALDQGQEQAPRAARDRRLAAGEGARRTASGALLVGYYDPAGHFRYAGRVGTGFDAKERTRLERLLAPLARERSPFEGKRGPRGARYVEPAARRGGRVHRVDQRRHAAPSLLQGPGRRRARLEVVLRPRASADEHRREPVEEAVDGQRRDRRRRSGP